MASESQSLPTHTKKLIVKEADVPSKPVFHDAALVSQPLAEPKQGEVVVKIAAAAFNHKDVRLTTVQDHR